MKKIVAMWILGMVAVVACGEEYRIFTDMDGRNIMAKIVEFNSSAGKLLIEREDGKQV